MLPGKVVDLIQHQLERLGSSEPAITIQTDKGPKLRGPHLLVVVLILLLRQVVPSESPAIRVESTQLTFKNGVPYFLYISQPIVGMS